MHSMHSDNDARVRLKASAYSLGSFMMRCEGRVKGSWQRTDQQCCGSDPWSTALPEDLMRMVCGYKPETL